ncbi:MAG: hypothetical protein Q8934_20145 [Bacillota bacterium]|nr:hypothetical protein [Bacillota bacterium]
MKRMWIGLLLAFLIFHGVSFLIFVLRMIWFPPTMMGMMMGKQMMFYHMFFWIKETFWLSLFFIGIILLIWVIRNNKGKKE